ncbi:MAG TPA: DUF5723 family protein [Balneolaceae bacterium]
MNKKSSKINHLLRLAVLVGLWILSLGPVQPLKAQPVLSAKSIAFGGSGTAYLGGFEATFRNPANLAISNRPGRLHFGIGHIGILYEPVLSKDAADNQFLNFTDHFYPYRAGSTDITANQRANILQRNYSRNSMLSQHQARVDIILGGVLWQGDNEAFSIVARARMASRIEVGRGWYSEDFIPSGDLRVRNFTLSQQKNHLYELSFGYAREFTFFNGLSPRLNKLYIGIAPKIVVAGPSVFAAYNARYIRNQEGNSTLYTSDFFYRSTGEYARATSRYLLSGNPRQAISNNLSRRYHFQPTGYGLGFDFGLTYMIPLGNELPAVSPDDEHSFVSKSIRLAFSVSDLGMIYYNKNPLTLSSPPHSVQIPQQSARNSMFIGAGGQYFSYFDSAQTVPNPLLNAQKVDRSSYSTLLPTSLNAGVLIELSRLKLMGDLTLGLNNTAFTTTKLMAHFGLEIRPARQIPVRFGARLAAGLPTRIGLGTGIETRYWDFTVGTQVILQSQALTSEFVGGAFAGIQVHL